MSFPLTSGSGCCPWCWSNVEMALLKLLITVLLITDIYYYCVSLFLWVCVSLCLLGTKWQKETKKLLPQALSQSWNTPVVGRLFNEQMRPKQNFFVTWEAGKKKKIHSSIIISHFSNFPSVKHGGRAMIWDCCAASHQHGLPLLMGESILKIYHWFQRKI